MLFLATSQKLTRQVTAIVGLREAITSKRLIIRIIWTLLLSVGIIGTLLDMYHTTDDYLKRPIATSVSKWRANSLYTFFFQAHFTLVQMKELSHHRFANLRDLSSHRS